MYVDIGRVVVDGVLQRVEITGHDVLCSDPLHVLRRDDARHGTAVCGAALHSGMAIIVLGPRPA